MAVARIDKGFEVVTSTLATSPTSAVRISSKKNVKLSFEDALGELETLIDKMEKGELSLEDSLASFERGIELTRTCQAALKAAEQKVEILTAKSVDAQLEPFAGDD